MSIWGRMSICRYVRRIIAVFKTAVTVMHRQRQRVFYSRTRSLTNGCLGILSLKRSGYSKIKPSKNKNLINRDFYLTPFLMPSIRIQCLKYYWQMKNSVCSMINDLIIDLAFIFSYSITR